MTDIDVLLQREPGLYSVYYGVVGREIGTIARWTGDDWQMIGTSTQVDDAHFARIGPRILPPSEPAPQVTHFYLDDQGIARPAPTPKAEASESDLEQARVLRKSLAAYIRLGLNPDAIAALDGEIAEALGAARREVTSAERERCVQVLRDRAAELKRHGADEWHAEYLYLLKNADYLAANKPQDITSTRDPGRPLPANISLSLGCIKDGVCRASPCICAQTAGQAPARDPVVLLRAEAERLRAVPYVDTEFYTDHQERQRLARSYQDAAELLGSVE